MHPCFCARLCCRSNQVHSMCAFFSLLFSSFLFILFFCFLVAHFFSPLLLLLPLCLVPRSSAVQFNLFTAKFTCLFHLRSHPNALTILYVAYCLAHDFFLFASLTHAPPSPIAFAISLWRIRFYFCDSHPASTTRVGMQYVNDVHSGTYTHRCHL